MGLNVQLALFVRCRLMTRSAFLLSFSIAALAAGYAPALAADTPIPVALATLQAGQWQLRSLDGSAPTKSLCLGDPRVLLQIRHATQTCTKFIITNSATETVVHYSCAATGNGRTSIRVETPRVIQIESQGIADKAPFDWAYEGRRVGDCSGTGPTALR
jgi:hypothetical protein